MEDVVIRKAVSRKQVTSREAGWTLIELAIALAIAGILVALGVGSLNGVRHAANGSEARNVLLASLVQARNAAALREQDVVLCPSPDQQGCAATHHWERGWIVFVDYDDNRTRGPDEPVLHGHRELASGIGLVTSTGRRTLDFQPNGSNAGSNATFTLCDGRGPGKATAFAMSNGGGLRPVTPTATAIVDACRLGG